MAAPKRALEIRDLGIEQLKADLAALAETSITIGWQGPSGKEIHPGAAGAVGGGLFAAVRNFISGRSTKGETVAQIAAWNEYGTENAAARPGLQTTFARNQKEFETAVLKAFADLVDNRTDLDGVVQRTGTIALDALRATLDDSRRWAEPLAESTIKRKGHDQPLLDTGTLRDKASWAHRDSSGSIMKQSEGDDA